MATTISITNLSNNRTFQQDGLGQADIPVSGIYTGAAPSAVEVNWRGLGWVTLDASPSGGTFSGVLSSQAAGQGTLEVRDAGNPGVTDSKSYITIGIIGICIFQSNMLGRGTNGQSYSGAFRATNFRLDHVWRELTDPSGVGGSGSVLPLLATYIMAETGVPVCLMNFAVSGKGLVNPSDWGGPGDAQYDDAIAAIAASGINGAEFVLAFGGEADSNNDVAAAAWAAGASAMLDSFQSDTGFSGIKMVVGQIGHNDDGDNIPDRDGLDGVRAGQILAWESDSDILWGPVTYDIDLNDGGAPADGLHFKTPEELATVAERWWAAIYYHFYGGSESGRGPRVASAAIGATTSELVITLSVDVGPVLAGASPTTGWRVQDATGVRTVVGVSVSSPTVRLTMDQPLLGPVLVSFGSFNDGVGATIVDSSTYGLPLEPFIEEPAGVAVGRWSTDVGVTVTLDGVDVSAYVMARSLFVRTQVGADTTLAAVELRDEDLSLNPYGWDELTIDVGGTRIFGGYVVEREAMARDALSGTHWALECKDWSLLLDTVVVTERYATYESGGVTYAWGDDEIVADLFATYLAGEGFDAATHVTQQHAVAEINFEGVSLRAALNQLALATGADWVIAPNKDVYWFDPVSPGGAVFDVDAVSPDWVASFPPLRGSLRRSVDDLNIVNDVTVIGGYLETTGDTAAFSFTAGQSTYTLPLKAKDVTQIRIETTGFGPYVVGNGDNQLKYATNGTLVEDGGQATILVDLATSSFRIDASVMALITAGDAITVTYTSLDPFTAQAEDAASIATYGRRLARTYYDESLAFEGPALYAQAVLDEFAFGRETIRFQVAEPGLVAGRLVTLTLPAVDVGGDILLLAEQGGQILEEDADSLATEASALSRDFLIQQVEYRPAATGRPDEFMVVCSVTCGYYQNTLVEALQRLGQKTGALSLGAGALPAVRYPGELSAISGGMGEIVAGRMTLTDGGTAPLAWTDYASHTGVVVGLDTSGTVPRGKFVLLEQGTVRAQVGWLTGLPAVGTVNPAGWGLYTSNGFFRGTVAASLLTGGTVTAAQILGGTVTGGLVSGGTVTGGVISGGTVSGALVSGGTVSGGFISGGTISGAVVTALQLIGGTIQTSGTVNSSNPGVRMDPTGLYGYGTVGLAFALFADGRSPLFSSGTITEVVYEIGTASVIRTNGNPAANGGVQIDDSGIFVYNTGGTLKTSIDAATGIIAAVDGQFSGVVTASTVTGGTVSGAVVTAAAISGGTVTGALVQTTDGNTRLTDNGLEVMAGTAVSNKIRMINGTAIAASILTQAVVAPSPRHETRFISAAHGGTPGWLEIFANGTAGAAPVSSGIVFDPEGNAGSGGTAEIGNIWIHPNYSSSTNVGRVVLSGERVRVQHNFSVGGTILSSRIDTPVFHGNIYLGTSLFADAIKFDQEYELAGTAAPLFRVFLQDQTTLAPYKLEINNGTVRVTAA